MLRQLLLNFDVQAGRFIPIQHLGLSNSAFGQKGQGVWTQDEWSRARAEGYDGFEGKLLKDEQEAQANFLSRSFGTERRKLESAWRVLDWLKTQNITSILELGCGEMISSWAIKARRPDIHYVASDFDPLTIERAAAVPALKDIEKRVVDVHKLSMEEISKFDLLIAWDVLYAFSSDAMLDLLTRISSTNARLMMCSGQIVGPFRGLSYAVKSRVLNYRRRLERGEIRDHGFKCSVAYYARLARSASMRCRLLETPPSDFRHSDCYNLLLFDNLV